MKRSIFIALTACVALAACTKNEVRPVVADQQITFQAVVNKPSTKAMIEGNTYVTANTFGTVAYLEEGATGSVYINTSEVKYSDFYWSTEKAYYWPVQGKLSFISYSPFKYQETGGTDISVIHNYRKLSILDYDVLNHQETDLMVADIQKGQTANTSSSGAWVKGVPTIFHHKLSRIDAINFQTVDTQNPSNVKDYANEHDGSESAKYMAGDQQYFINQVVFKDTYFTGSYSYDGTAETVSQSWTKGSSAESSTQWYTETTTNSSGKFSGGKIATDRDGSTNYLLILPQEFENPDGTPVPTTIPSLYIKYTVRTYYENNVLADATSGYTDEVIETTVPLYQIHSSDHKWDMNKRITYTVSLTKQRIYWDPSVTDWSKDNSPTVSI